MRRFITSTLVALAALCVATGDRPVSAAEDRPFSADAIVEIVDSYKNGFLTEGVGVATHLGEINVNGAVRVFGHRSTSTITLVAANGDSITLQSESEFDPDLGHFFGIFVVTDGTGRFADATGYGTIEPVPLGGGLFNVLYDGVLSY